MDYSKLAGEWCHPDCSGAGICFSCWVCNISWRWNAYPQDLAQDSREHRSCCKMIWSCGVLISRYIKQSSAKSRTRIRSGRSFIWHRNSRGTVPCGTPEMTGVSSDDTPSNTTLIWRHVRKLVNQAWREPLIPYLSNLYGSLSCGTASKAFEKSSISMSTWVPAS